jgi:NADH:ubiquinone oxidoreductase subunit E/NAD-dependent dihydropyrimidine dehydrogenase PreA subunit
MAARKAPVSKSTAGVKGARRPAAQPAARPAVRFGSHAAARAAARPASRAAAKTAVHAAAPHAGNGKGKPVGSVLVVGAGIAGIQSSLDLAECGYKVYLVEKGPSIGGVMTQLDKTFPTNDCSMCIVSPKLVEASRHNNIELYSYSEVDKVEGQAGAFNVTLRKKARSVDLAKCTGCGACMAACPVEQRIRVPEPIPVEIDETVRKTDALIDRYPPQRASLIMILQDVNAAFNYLPEPALLRIAERLALPYAEVYGTASFYKAFSLEPRGEHLVQVCLGTACHVRGAQRILEEFERILSVKNGMTTEDRKFTLESVNCLGACALGPIVVVDGEYHGSMTMSGVSKVIDAYAKRGKP